MYCTLGQKRARYYCHNCHVDHVVKAVWLASSEQFDALGYPLFHQVATPDLDKQDDGPASEDDDKSDDSQSEDDE